MTLNRRSFLLGASALSLGALAACQGSPTGGSTATGDGSGGGVLPSYFPYSGVKTDIAGVDGRSTPISFSIPEAMPTLYNAAPGNGDVFTALTMASQAPPSLDANPYWQLMNERLGASYEPVLVPPADYVNKFATVVAGDELPDFYVVLPATPAIAQLLEARSVNLSNYLAGDAISQYPGLANIPTASWAATAYAGGVRGIPISRGLTNSFIMYKRLDLLESLGLAHDPATLDDWFEFLKAANNPAQNVWALGSLPTEFVRQALGIPNQWSVDGGAFTSAYEHDAQEDALEFARTVWEEGLVNPDAPAVFGHQQREWYLAGTALTYWETISGWALSGAGDGTVEGFRGTGMVPPSANGTAGTPHLGNPNNSFVAVSKAAEDRIDSLLAIADWLAAPFGTDEWLTKNYGAEGVDFERMDGTIVPDPDKAPQRGIGLGYVSSPAMVAFYPDRSVAERQHEFETRWSEHAVADPSIGVYSETMSRKFAQLQTVIDAAAADIVTGRAPVSSWSGAVQAFLDGGGTVIKDELAAAYGELNS